MLLKKALNKRLVIFVLFALFAVVLMGTTMRRARYSDLHSTAMQMAAESSGAVRCGGEKLAMQSPHILLRANCTK